MTLRALANTLLAALFEPPWCDIAPGNPQGTKAPLVKLLRTAVDKAQISAEIYTGSWTDVGTPERLALLNTPKNTLTDTP